MRIAVDLEKCIGAGQCALVAPEVFDQRDDDGVVVVLNEAPGDDLKASVREAAMLCPAQVISLDEG
jgi:ferredoxin